MKEQELISKLRQLQNLQAENEIVEFKEAKAGYDFSKLGKYFSALSNEANLLKKECAWLVFGIENKKHKIVGTKFRENRPDLDSLKKSWQIRPQTGSPFGKFMNCICLKAG
jgi:ATP-dependent DNA helicase RecG